MTDRLEASDRTNRELVERLNASPGGNPPAADPDPPKPFLDKFAEDPEGAIKTVVIGGLREVAPVLNTMITSGHSAFVGLEADAVDREFGTATATSSVVRSTG
jgi:hypothetical protein